MSELSPELHKLLLVAWYESTAQGRWILYSAHEYLTYGELQYKRRQRFAVSFALQHWLES